MKKFELLEHTADMKIRAYGRTRGEQFANAAVAVFSLMSYPEKVKPLREEKIAISADDLKSLLYQWIESLLFLLDTKNFLLSNVKNIKVVEKNKKYFVEAVVIGDKYKECYETFGGVKAPTYNDMEIRKNYVQFVVDI